MELLLSDYLHQIKKGQGTPTHKQSIGTVLHRRNLIVTCQGPQSYIMVNGRNCSTCQIQQQGHLCQSDYDRQISQDMPLLMVFLVAIGIFLVCFIATKLCQCLSTDRKKKYLEKDQATDQSQDQDNEAYKQFKEGKLKDLKNRTQ